MKKIKIKSFSKKIIADTITPVEVYLKIRDRFPNSILLESSDYMQTANNFSFICFNQTGFFELKNHSINLKYPGEKPKEIQLSNKSITEYLNDYINGYDVEKSKTKFISNGLFGYMSHESVKYQEKIKFNEGKDDLDIPDIFYGFYQNIIAISLFNHEAHIYCNSCNGENNIEEVEDIINAKNYSVFDLRICIKGFKNTVIKKIRLNLIGRYNILNSVSAIAVSLHIGIKINIIKNSLKKFTGIQRRLTKVHERNSKEFFDDYAHHPTEIKSVLESIKMTYKNRKIIAVFQPHRYSRLKFLKKDFASSFKNSNLVILCPVYAAGEKIDKNYDQIEFAKLITLNSNVQVILIKDEKDLRKFFIKNLISNELIICMGAGSISKWIREIKI